MGTNMEDNAFSTAVNGGISVPPPSAAGGISVPPPCAAGGISVPPSA